jgi:hypothetical protein
MSAEDFDRGAFWRSELDGLDLQVRNMMEQCRDSAVRGAVERYADTTREPLEALAVAHGPATVFILEKEGIRIRLTPDRARRLAEMLVAHADHAERVMRPFLGGPQ